jgi:AcrR family transcriptional regulator
VPIDTRDQLIEVATSAFARDGIAATSLRAIAKEAGVSPALVVHHFGSREKLIEDCIIKALGLWVSEKQEFVDVSLSTALTKWQGSIAEHGVKLQFFRQVLLAGGEPANALFSRMVKETQMVIESQAAKGRMRKVENQRDFALLLTLQELAPLMLQSEVADYLGTSHLDPETQARITIARVDLLTKGILRKPEKGSGKKKKSQRK